MERLHNTSKMPWFAHSLQGRSEADWESQANHARHVQIGAELRAEKFGMGSYAAAAGTLHDLGKFNPDFLTYIRGGTKRGPDHSSAGAIYAREKFGRAGLLLAHAIAAHHAGLCDRLFDPAGRLARKAGELAAVVHRAREDVFPLPDQLESRVLPRNGFQLAFLIRMLLSCLVDADRTATETFGNGGEPLDRAFRARPEALSEHLAEFMASEALKREKTDEGLTPLNRLRARILESVAAKAELPQGVFTLTVPTGGGKTLTVLRFALDHAKHHKLDRVILVIPFVSVIDQSAEVYRKALNGFEDHILEHHSSFEDATVDGPEERCEGRTPLQFGTETWDAPVVVTTAVLFFESLFGARTGRCRKLHNIARSVVVLDEAQTIPLHLLRPCVAALKALQENYNTTVVLCTATQPALEDRPDEQSKPAHERRSFAGGFVGVRELAPDVNELFRALKRVEIRHIDVQDDDALAARMSEAEQALCIVNSRAHARELFDLLKKRNVPGVRHLSTLMLPDHRRRALHEIKEDLTAGRPCRVVATSLVEAGVDFSFPLVLRAEAGLEQIVQAAGRANRNGELGEGRFGAVLVFKAAGRKPLQGMEDNVSVGRAILRNHADILTPAAMEAYFQMLYWTKGADELDRHGVLAQCEAAAEDLDFPFATIADEMRLITDVNVPLIVPLTEESRAEVDVLRYADQPGRAVRRLQRWTVNIPSSARLKLVADKAAEVIRADRYGDAFVVLNNRELYDPEVGLKPEEPMLKSDTLII